MFIIFEVFFHFFFEDQFYPIDQPSFSNDYSANLKHSVMVITSFLHADSKPGTGDHINITAQHPFFVGNNQTPELPFACFLISKGTQ